MVRVNSRWRRFRPQRLKEFVRRRPEYSGLFWRAQAIVDGEVAHLGRRQRDLDTLDVIIDQYKQRMKKGDVAASLALLILQAPRAASAQQKMDKHPHGMSNKTARLYELIDFNDAYVDTVLNLPEDELSTFDSHVKTVIDKFCKRFKTRCFSNEQWEAIVYGLSREIAVYNGAIREGFGVRMTSRSEDARGVDMVISDPESGRSINVDIKTRSSYHFRLKDLAREGRITNDEWEQAEKLGYCSVVNGHGGEAVEVTLLRVDHEVLGEIIDFKFENSELLGRELRKILLVE